MSMFGNDSGGAGGGGKERGDRCTTAADDDHHPYSTGLGMDRPLHANGGHALLKMLHHVVRALKSVVMHKPERKAERKAGMKSESKSATT